jgi:hypothetical protein
MRETDFFLLFFKDDFSNLKKQTAAASSWSSISKLTSTSVSRVFSFYHETTANSKQQKQQQQQLFDISNRKSPKTDKVNEFSVVSFYCVSG